MARELAPRFLGHEVILHATKGVEEGTLKRISVVLREEIPCPRIGVISGPNLADEFARGEIGATVVASSFDEVIEAGQKLLSTEQFRVFGSHDIVGVEWAGTLKNILAIASGCLDGMKMGWNARAMLISRGLAEMVRFGEAMGADPATFMGLSGVGDLLATCSSPLSRNYRIGFALAQGKTLDQAVEELGATTEGVKTALTVSEYAHGRKIMMPITDAVCAMIRGEKTFGQALHELMTIPVGAE
jgi:glycerol-3-phosphate dehydrogenase (NAD(P)+)